MPGLVVRGVRYEVEERGSGAAVLLLHGFTGSLETWDSHLRALDGLRAIRLDMLGHGRSEAPADPARYRMEEVVEDLAAIFDALAVERAAVVGYSMGGRVALRFGLAHPERCWALVLESASPGIAEADERAKRIEADERLARLLETEGIEAFVRYWESLPLWATQERLPQEVRQALRALRLAQRPHGLANSLRGLGAGHDHSVLDRLGGLQLPVLLITGALDEKYVALAAKMRARLPNARWVNVPGAGHAVHLEAPETFTQVVSEFLRAHAPSRAERGVQ